MTIIGYYFGMSLLLLLDTPTKKHSKPPLVSKAPVVTSTPQPVTHSVVTTVKAQPTPATKIDDDSSSVHHQFTRSLDLYVCQYITSDP